MTITTASVMCAFAFAAVAALGQGAETDPPFSMADPAASPAIAKILREPESKRAAAADPFWQELRKDSSPLIEAVPGDRQSSLVTFAWAGEPGTSNVLVFGSVSGFDVTKSQLIHIDGTNIWYRTYQVRNDARFTYAFSPNDTLEPLEKLDRTNVAAVVKRFSKFKADPLNPRHSMDALPSYVELADAPPQPWITPRPDVAKGKVEQKKIASTILKNERNAWIYTPTGFTPSGDRYPLLVVFDGAAYIAAVPVPVILDNLIAAKRIPPMVAIVLDNPTPASRDQELSCSPSFADFLAHEVVPWMRDNYHATLDPSQIVVAGSSLGGLAATFAGFKHPEVFGNVLSQAGSFWWGPQGDAEGEWLTRQFLASPRLNLRLFLEVGLMEDKGTTRVSGPPMIAANRHMRDALTAKHYAMDYREFNGGHEYVNWRGSFADGLLYLMGKN